MSVLDDSVVQVPVEALLDICHIFHLAKKFEIDTTLGLGLKVQHWDWD